jgi:hypothetical protein
MLKGRCPGSMTTRVQNESLTNMFWGMFFVWFGVTAYVTGGDPVAALDSPVFALGTGLLLLGLNLVRSLFRLRLSILTMGLGALVTMIYVVVVFFDFWVPFLPALIVIAGVALIIGAVRTRNFKTY